MEAWSIKYPPFRGGTFCCSKVAPASPPSRAHQTKEAIPRYSLEEDRTDFHRLTNDVCLTLSPPLVFVPSIRRRASTSSINNRNGRWAAKTRGPIHPNVNIGQTTSSCRGWPVASRSGTRSSSPAFSRFLPFPPIFIPLVFITRLLEVSIFKGSFSQ